MSGGGVRPQIDLVWEPNLTAAANEDHKGYHALMGAFLATLRGENVGAPTIADGAGAMALLERAIKGATARRGSLRT